MFNKKVWLSSGVCLACVFAISACDRGTLADLAAPASSGDSLSSADTTAEVAGLSDGRKNAALFIAPTPILVDLLQRDLADLNQHPCFPEGNPGLGFVRWTSRLYGAFPPPLLTPGFNKSEYDRLSTKHDTDYVLSVRIPEGSNYPHFTQVEFNFRAVNPYEAHHVARGMPAHYLPHEADYPSNDNILANRSLIDMAGGPVAIVVRGVNFMFPPHTIDRNTSGWMNYLGPFGWVAFMRDDAFQSGRFYSILGALTGAPRALTDTVPPPPGDATDDGFFQSVQVRGDTFDANSETPSWLAPPVPTCNVCPTIPPGPPTPSQAYAFLDFSNRDTSYPLPPAPAPGRGGFVFVIRPWALSPMVVIDPSANPGNTPALGNMIPAPASGYNEAALHAAGLINHPAAVDGPPGPAGAHEISISVFFIHTWAWDGPCATEPCDEGVTVPEY